MKAKLPPVQQLEYNEMQMGIAGEIGMGQYGVRYIQTAIPIQEIGRLSIVAELPDSERWPVRQLRLSALKRLDRERKGDLSDPDFKRISFEDWHVPIVLLIFPPIEKKASTGTPHRLLENIRDIFVTINTTAQTPNRCRTILLN